MKGKTAIVVAGIMGVMGVGLGAFGAHALESELTERGTVSTWETGVHYLHWHTLAVLAIGLGLRAGVLPERWMSLVWIWVAGCLFFSGSLFGLALGGPGWLGPVTPIGGVLFMVGWAMLAGLVLKRERPSG